MGNQWGQKSTLLTEKQRGTVEFRRNLHYSDLNIGRKIMSYEMSKAHVMWLGLNRIKFKAKISPT